MTGVLQLEGWALARKHLPDTLGKRRGLRGMFARRGITDCEVVGPLGYGARLDAVPRSEIAVGLVGEDDCTLIVEHRDMG